MGTAFSGEEPAAGPRDAHAKRAYDAFAPAYETFTHGYQYRRWTGRLLEKAEDAGLEGNRLLDVGCGTGLSFLALLDQNWEVTGCDISPRMIEEARRKVGDAATLLVADMRDLPVLGEFDLVWAINDSLNYLLTSGELEAALARMRANLAPGGVIVFDLNTLQSYQTFFSEKHVVERDGKRLVWEGQAGDIASGSVCEAHLRVGGDVEPHVHRQRHFPEAEVMAAIEVSGLTCAEVAGELEGDLDPFLEEDHHTKAVYVCRA